MSKKSGGVVLDSATPFGIGVCEELQKEADFMRSKLEASKQRKLMLAAEVRFLRKRYKYLVKMKNTNSFNEQSHVQAPSSLKRAKIVKEPLLIRKEASHQRSYLVPEPTFKKKHAPSRDAFPIVDQSRKKKSYGGKEAKGRTLPSISTQVFDLNHKGIMHTRKDMTPIFDRNQKERMFDENDAAARNSTTAAFDLNQDTTGEREARLPTRAPIFDLNEISTGDEDFQCNVEANKFLIRGMNEEQQNDLKLSICRNSGESSSRAGKRKISWQDPVALRV